MNVSERSLRRIRGIGKVLAVRLAEAGLDDYGKIAEAGEERLRAVRGMNPRAVPSILAQASQLAGTDVEAREDRIVRLKAQAGKMREEVVSLAEGVRQRLGEELEGKKGRKLEKEIFRLIDTLGRMENGQELRPKRTERGLAKAQRRLHEAAEGGAKKTRKTLKRARKALQRAQT